MCIYIFSELPGAVSKTKFWWMITTPTFDIMYLDFYLFTELHGIFFITMNDWLSGQPL